ncbi:quaternary ammonium compound-resistance protein [Striga asiatica]|uniref:Quaternary ammonium compound-resistance protein n=1 Tax=Striga asiatica TaxID=4170 RepID=A0A5A7R7E8_STRAF|nr:quaternary ammonium compound-resistance protein [Striga asiatica]
MDGLSFTETKFNDEGHKSRASPLGALGAQITPHDPRVKKLHQWRVLNTPRSLVLVNRRPLANRIVHQFIKRPTLHYLDLQWPNRLKHSILPVHRVQRILHRQAALLQHRSRNSLRPLPELPVKHIMPRDSVRVRIARVLNQTGPKWCQVSRCTPHRILQLHLPRLVRVDAQHHVFAAHEVELRGVVLESRHAQHVPDSIPSFLLRLTVAHGGDEGVGDFAGLAERVEIHSKVALGGGVHGADEGEAAARVKLECRDVLGHGPGYYNVHVFRIWPDAGDYPLPRVPATALGFHEGGEIRVGFEDPGHGFPDRRVGYERVDGSDGADAEDFEALAEAAEHLGVHALVGVWAEDGLVGGGVVGVRVEGAVFEVGGFVVAGEDGAGGEAAGGFGLAFDEEEAVEKGPPPHLLFDRRHHLAFTGRCPRTASIPTHIYIKELEDGLGAENGGGVAVGYAVDIRQDVIVGDDGQNFLESFAVGPPVEGVPLQVLDIGIPGEYLGQDTLLDLVGVLGHVLDVLQFLSVVLGHALLAGFFGRLRHNANIIYYYYIINIW